MPPSKTPPLTANESAFHDPDAMLATLKQVITRSTQKSASRFAPLISAVSIALCHPNAKHAAADQEIEVHVYTPFNGGDTSATYKRLEGYLHSLQPEEMARFVRLVDQVRGETADEEEEDEDGEGTSKMKKLRKLLAEHVRQLSARNAHVANLERQLKQQDDESEEDEETASKLVALQRLLDEKDEKLEEHLAYIGELKEQLAKYHRGPEKHPLQSLMNRDDDDDAAAKINDARDADDVEDGAPTSDHDIELELSGDETELPKAEGGMFDPICISSAEETDSDIEDED